MVAKSMKATKNSLLFVFVAGPVVVNSFLGLRDQLPD